MVAPKTRQLFLREPLANPPVGGQIAECLWNLDYTPDFGWPPANVLAPVVGVNWCEAYAYCSWRGRRLCGQVGGGPCAFSGFDDANASQWFNGCSAQGNSAYPYGATYDSSTCNGFDFGQGATVESAATMPPCIGGVLDLWHMSGNVREWEDSCSGTTGPSDDCRTRGGSFQSSDMELPCAADDDAARDYTATDLGFRCCS